MIYVIYERGPEARPKLYRSSYDANVECERRIRDYRERYGESFARWYVRDVLRCATPIRFLLDQWPIALLFLFAIFVGWGLAL